MNVRVSVRLAAALLRTVLACVVAAGGILAAIPVAPAHAQTAQDGFSASLNNSARAIVVQPDGKIIVGGPFTTVNGAAVSYLARLNPDGSRDTTFNPAPDQYVRVLALQPDGKILVGGSFTSIAGASRSYLARLNPNGTLDTAFNPQPNLLVTALVLQPDGKILVGGTFTTMGGQSRKKIARLNPDGSLDTTFNPGQGANGDVYAVALQPDGKVVLGGSFTTLDGQPRSKIGRLLPNGALDTAFNPGADDIVWELVTQADGAIVAGGEFSQMGGQTRKYIARLRPDGSLDSSFNPNANGYISALAVQPDGQVLVGGNFGQIAGTTRYHIARFKANGSLDTTFDPSADDPVSAFAVQPDGKILLGGTFTTVGGQPNERIARLNADGTLDTALDPQPSGFVRALALQPDDKILMGGNFLAVGGTPRGCIARLYPNGLLDSAFTPGADNTIWAIALQPDGKILVGGNFTTIGGQARNRIARLNANGTVDTSFNPGAGANGAVVSVVVQPDGRILVGGFFSTLGSYTRNHIGRLNANGTVDTSFNPDANDVVMTMALDPYGRIVVGGWFTQIGGQARGRIARLSSNGTLDPTFNENVSFNGVVRALALQPDGKILVGGDFTTVTVGMVVYLRDRLARLHSSGAVDTFNPGANDAVNTLAFQTDGKIIVGGDFTQLGGGARSRIGRLNANGTLDTAWAPPGGGANGDVLALAIQGDGEVVVGGEFTTLGGQARQYIGRLSPATAAFQHLGYDPSRPAVTWLRSGPGPEVRRVTLDISYDGLNYDLLCPLERVDGGWEFAGFALPCGRDLFLRTRGYYATGEGNGSGSVVQAVRHIHPRCRGLLPLVLRP